VHLILGIIEYVQYEFDEYNIFKLVLHCSLL